MTHPLTLPSRCHLPLSTHSSSLPGTSSAARLALASCVVQYGGPMFDGVSHTRSIATLLEGLNAAAVASHVKFLCTVIGTIHTPTTPTNNSAGASSSPSPSALAAVEALATLARNGKISHRPYVCAVVVAVLTRWACFDKEKGLASAPGLGLEQGQKPGKSSKKTSGQTTKGSIVGGLLEGLPGLSVVGVSVSGLLDAIGLSEGQGGDEEEREEGKRGSGKSADNKGGKVVQKQDRETEGENEEEDGDERFAALQALASTKLLALLADLGHMTVAQLAITDTNSNDNNNGNKVTDSTNNPSGNGNKGKKGVVGLEQGSAEGQGLAQGKALCVTLLDVAVATVRYLLTERKLRLYRNDNGDDEEKEEEEEDSKSSRKLTKPSSYSSSSSSAVLVLTEEHSAVLSAMDAMTFVMPHYTPCLSYHHTNHHHTTHHDHNHNHGRGHRVREALYMLLGQAVFHVLASEDVTVQALADLADAAQKLGLEEEGQGSEEVGQRVLSAEIDVSKKRQGLSKVNGNSRRGKQQQQEEEEEEDDEDDEEEEEESAQSLLFEAS